MELAWAEVRIVAGKRSNSQVRHSTFNICNLELENIAGKMEKRSWSWCLNMPHARMWPDTTVKTDNRETHHQHPNALHLNSVLGPAAFTRIISFNLCKVL